MPKSELGGPLVTFLVALTLEGLLFGKYTGTVKAAGLR
jgi:hypothetical protein